MIGTCSWPACSWSKTGGFSTIRTEWTFAFVHHSSLLLSFIQVCQGMFFFKTDKPFSVTFFWVHPDIYVGLGLYGLAICHGAQVSLTYCLWWIHLDWNFQTWTFKYEWIWQLNSNLLRMVSSCINRNWE